jgi:hypothetical protein
VTADPRLNSVHLDASRREDFRRAREELLNARGFHTLVAEGSALAPAKDDLRTLNEVAPPEAPPEAPPSLDYCLRDQERVYPLKIGLNTIGRAPENDVVVKDAYISRRHCAILIHAGDGGELFDTASKNGTYVNGQKLSGPTPLKPGDEIRICDRQLVFLSGTNDPAAVDRTHVE